MRGAVATSFWGMLAVAPVAVIALYSGCSDQASERRGGGEIPDLTAGSGMIVSAEAGAGGALGEAGAAGAAAVPPPVPWCAAYKVINCVCQQCHQNPTINGAPVDVPLVTYDDTQAPYGVASLNRKVWQEMQTVIKSGFMPFTGLEDPPVSPPVQPLDAERKATLLTWLAEGAHDEGGQDCPMACDWTKGPPDGGE